MIRKQIRKVKLLMIFNMMLFLIQPILLVLSAQRRAWFSVVIIVVCILLLCVVFKTQLDRYKLLKDLSEEDI